MAAYLGAALAFLGADMAWFGLTAQRLYGRILGDLLAPSVNLSAAFAFYLVFPLGLTIFAIVPASTEGSATAAARRGGLFGFFAYATYDLTNQATLRGWTTALTLVDIAWGTALAAFAAFAGYQAARLWQRRAKVRP